MPELTQIPPSAPRDGVPPRRPASLSTDAIDFAIDVLARAVDHPLDLGVARGAALARLAQGGTAIEGLSAACVASGLRAELRQGSAKEVLRGAVAGSMSVVAERADGFVVVSWGRDGRVLVQRSDGGPELIAPSPERLAAVMGSAGPEEPVTWLAAPPAAPLQSLSATGDPSHHGGHGGGDHGDHHASPFERVRALLRLERDDLWVVLVYAIAVGLLSLATPVAVQALVNSVAFGALLQPIVVLSVIVTAVLSFAAVLRALQVRVVELVQRRIFVRVALDVSHRLPRVEVSANDDRYGPELVNRFFDVLTVQKSAAIFLLDGLALVLQAGIGLMVLAFYHPALLALDVALLLGVAFVVFTLGRGAPASSIEESRAKYAVAAWLEEIARLPRAFRSASGARFATARADLLARRYLDARGRHFAAVYRQIVGSLALQVVANALVLGLGGALVIGRQLTLGQLVAAELIVTAIVASFAKLGKHLETWYDLLAAADKLGHLADLPLETRGSSAYFSDDPRGADVRFDGVTLSYPNGRTAIDALDLSLRPGARVAIVGRSGEGKSTVAAMLDAIRLPSGGSITIDGVDLREASPEALRERVAVVSTEIEVLEQSVFENLAVGRAEVTRRDAWEALASVGLDELVRALPGGLDEPLSPRGAPLHHGATVRLMFARALAARPRLIVVDDALRALDDADRGRVEAALFHPNAPWTLIALCAPDDPLLRRVDAVIPLSRRATSEVLQ